ncbi:hypothetical protein [Treponema bryantii]|uniref:hypothetical protein n=1 Tax=Treponema bryantii TaxID=163 RepID=UPI002B3074B7|nr:hypothetical protein TRBR_17260 [Treponema bryantii]
MKQVIFFISILISIFFITACSNAYPDITNAPSISNLNYQSGGYLSWEAINNASSYNIYMIDKDNKATLIQTSNKTEAFIKYASVEVAVSGIINGKETYLSEKSKANNLWWTKVTCNKIDSGYSLTWNAVPGAEDYVLISKYKSESGMNYSTTNDACEYSTKDLTEYHNQPAVPGSWSNTTLSKKCKSLNTTNNNAIYDGNYFTSSYAKYIHLYAKIGDTYYCISDKINLK